ncbi:hypothetical protein DFH08DRAFT_846859 [Mycena albidolilacea]|uniref:Uncharacterized protein n=1 Tax=Mycena albidolilacea TaxID=1033008 RepID=A0AAD7AIT1_9AGAR|nr:hypothetical protein DFH08DRAFT_846859 [Mycena albidolilacea]
MCITHKVDLPVELEREIFELVASTDVATALRLAVAARRVQVWVEPIIYSKVVVAHAPEDRLQMQYARTVLWDRTARAQRSQKASNQPKIPRFIRTIPFRPESFFARHVKSLQIGHLSELELVTVLSACTGISELGWWANVLTPLVIAALNLLTLRRLSVDPSFDFARLTTAPMFATITHLDICFHNYLGQQVLPPLVRFSTLTHFSVHHSLVPSPTWCDDVLELCPRLKILLRFSDKLFFEELSGLRQRHADLRIVVMQQPVGVWTARWVHDAWPVAENIVRERRKIAAAERKATADASEPLS